MNYLQRMLPILAAILLAACQTVPLHESTIRDFTLPTKGKSGVIRITGLHIPKDEPVATLLLALAAAGGADINQHIYVSLFDATDEKTRYLGTMAVYDMSRWLEIPVPAGKRTLMLTLAGGRSSVFVEGIPAHADFIEVDVSAGGVSHVVVSRYGFMRFPYLGEVMIDKANQEQCLAMTGTPRERQRKIEEYMVSNKVNQYARDFKNFCLLLSAPKLIQTPSALAENKFAEQSASIETFRREQFPKWQAEGEKRPPYNLMRVYEPFQSLQP